MIPSSSEAYCLLIGVYCFGKGKEIIIVCFISVSDVPRFQGFSNSEVSFVNRPFYSCG